MTHVYRFTIDSTGVSFAAPGRLQQAEGAYVVVAELDYAAALALHEHASREQPVTIWVDVGGHPVAFMRAQKVRVKGRGRTVELWALVHIPSIWDQAVRA